nr:ferric reductase-like transmembrane domain-containing protein [Ktedonobacterales bacterium]
MRWLSHPRTHKRVPTRPRAHWLALALGAALAVVAGILAAGAPAHAAGAFAMTLTGTENASKTATAKDGTTTKRVKFSLRTTNGTPRLAIMLETRETLLAAGQTTTITGLNGQRIAAIGTLSGNGAASDPIGGAPLFDLRVRGAVLPNQSLLLLLTSPSGNTASQLSLQVTFQAGEGKTIAGPATGTLTLAPGTPSAVTSDVWGTTAGGGAIDPALWYVTRGAGATAYLLLAVVVALGISLGVRTFEGVLRGWKVLDLHQMFTLLMLAFVGLHLVTLVLDPFLPFSVGQIFWPFGVLYRPVATALGILSFYLLLAIAASAYLRHGIGKRIWYGVHLTSYVAFILLTLHGLLAGTDSRTPWM